MDNIRPRVDQPRQTSCLAFLPSTTTILLIGFFIICLLMNGDITPLTKRGFFCSDVSINKPYHLDTIGIKTLLFIALVLPCMIIKFCDKRYDRLAFIQRRQVASKSESIRKRRKISDDIKKDDLGEEEEVIFSSLQVKKRLSKNGSGIPEPSILVRESVENNLDIDLNEADVGEETQLFTPVPLNSDDESAENDATSSRSSIAKPTRDFSETQLFFFGLCTTMFLTGVGKITGGRLRPHFLQRCQPNIDCSAAVNSNKYIEDFTCTNSNLRHKDLSYIATSWPSGHASIMFYSMLYLILYMNKVFPVLVSLSPRKVRQRYDPMIMYTIYTLLIATAGFIALTRVSDYHHHPLDVLSGSILGTVTAIAIFRSLSKQYACPELDVDQ